MHFRPVWDWALSLVDHPRLFPHFVWDAEKIFKYNGATWIRCFSEPWTSKDWWNIQVMRDSESSHHEKLTSCSASVKITEEREAIILDYLR